ncbi:hypothetical protein QC764_403935 [Podospora pseudoanserina]|uniref:Fungal N-terminal domain-containing protein n=1 Tax=Podospora pseudoanserina TaxID=2609844 RepID=A0ABR0I8W2_9PEZI|nr:hypothetical protein QC764_403935 [Podospora pseudoanserina]
MLDQIIILQDSAQRLSTTYNSLTYRVLCSDNSFRDLANSIKAVSMALDSCRGLLGQLRSGTTSIPITSDLSPRLEANLKECKVAFADAYEKAKKMMPQQVPQEYCSHKLSEIYQLAEMHRLTSRLYAREREIYRVVQAVRLQIASPLLQTSQNILSNVRQPFGQPLPIRGTQPGLQFQPQRFQWQFNTPNINEKSHRPPRHVHHHQEKHQDRHRHRVLLGKGADPTATLNAASSQLTAIHLASYHNNVAALEAIKESMTTIRTFTYTPQYQIHTRYTQFQPTNYTGQWKWTNLLKQKNFWGMTPLHWAATGVCPEAIKFSLKEVEDAGLRREVIDSKDREGRTALLVVGLGCNKFGGKDAVTKIAKALVKAGASPDVADWRGQTPREMLTDLEIEKPDFPQKEQQTYGVAGGYYQGYGGY